MTSDSRYLMYDNKLATISEVSKLLGLSPSTLRRMEVEGELTRYGLTVIYTPGGQRRYLFNPTRHLYSQQGFSAPLAFGQRPALLIRDLTIGFCTAESQLCVQLDDQLNAARTLIETFAAQGHPVIFSRTVYDPAHAFSALWGEKFPAMRILEAESHWIRKHEALANYAYDLELSTHYVSDLKASKLEAFLDRNRIDTVVLAGVTTSGSIRTNAIDLFQSGRRTVIPSEAVADRTRPLQDFTLLDLNSRYAEVTTLSRTLAELA